MFEALRVYGIEGFQGFGVGVERTKNEMQDLSFEAGVRFGVK
jgi:hypothetical protein